MLEEERVYDADRLPTDVVIPVLAALHEAIPAALDALGSARTLIRRYLWRAFITTRYESSASTNSLQDLRGLRATLRTQRDTAVPIFNEVEYPLPTLEVLKRAGWPKRRDILARGMLATALREGGYDLADGTPAMRANVRQREYHHLFPDSLITTEGKLDSITSYLTLNCALITWNTNRNIGAKEPLEYLRQRVERATLGEEEIRARLKTHLIPFDELNVGGYSAIEDENRRAKQIASDYRIFLEKRAGLILEAIRKLASGAAL